VLEEQHKLAQVVLRVADYIWVHPARYKLVQVEPVELAVRNEPEGEDYPAQEQAQHMEDSMVRVRVQALHMEDSMVLAQARVQHTPAPEVEYKLVVL
jgi:hypothetical protein